MNYKKINNLLGWLVFIIATTVYFMTLEDTVSLWDCGEYVTAAYKLEVGHPPGAPLFMVLGRLASFFADPENVAVWINRLSALCSSATILFMFWSVSMLVKKMILRTKSELDTGDKIAIFGSALVGSLAYTFSDSFWFSAVEGEVYAMSSLFTAIIFWAGLRWDEEMIAIQKGYLHPKGFSPDRWMLFIMFMLGLAIGVHLLGILVVPAIAYVIYFRYNGISRRFFNIFIGITIATVVFGIFRMGVSGGDVIKVIFMNAIVLGILFGVYLASRSSKILEFILVGLMSIVILSFIQEGMITGSISFLAFLEIGLVKGLGMPFFSGTIVFFLLLIGTFVYMLRKARTSGNRIFYSAVMGLLLLLIGYGSFSVIVIRSNANTPLDENDPENPVTLHAYLKREQYGSAPIAYGPFWNSTEKGGQWQSTGGGSERWVGYADKSEWEDQSPIHLRRFVVFVDDEAVKAFTNEERANQYANKTSGAEVRETYFESNEKNRKNATPTYSQNTFFPRMYWSGEQARIDSYKEWSGYDPTEEKGTDKGKDGNRLPTFGENLGFFFKYQVNWMYIRYFHWNFTGRQNDIQGSRGDAMRGNWVSGFSAVDDARLGSQENAPYYTTQNEGNNNFFFLPLILGLIGLFYHVYRAPKDAFVLFLAFLFTGLAIVVYLNQKTLEPRERDYAYAGSFYFFAMWIGLGVYGLYDAFRNMSKDVGKKLGISAGVGLLLFLIFDINSVVGMPLTTSWLIIILIGGLALAVMTGLGRVLKSGAQGAVVATILGLFIPIMMGMQGWDDHDRSLKTSARDLAYNYLKSCGDNGIIFTNGDNDTFPLWYMQEVEGKFTNVRVCNLSLMQTDWYTNQMKMKAYDSDPLPIRFTEDQILMNYGATDQVLFSGLMDLLYNGADKEIVKKMLKLRVKTSPKEARAATERLMAGIPQVLSGAQASNPQLDKQMRQYAALIAQPIGDDLSESAFEKFFVGYKIFEAVRSQSLKVDQEKYQILTSAVLDFELGWDITNLREAMAFVRNDDNMIPFGSGPEKQMLRVFPSTGFVMPVNNENVVKSGMVSKEELKDCAKEIRFRFKYDAEFDKMNAQQAAQMTENGLTREQVMMLDIIANNNWKRPIYFSSPSGSEISSALMRGYSGRYTDGYVKQNGMAFELTPLQGRSSGINRDRMYDNMMNQYKYGEMNNPDVLTDYYTRRHTAQYRSNFLRLAREYVTDALQAEQYYATAGMDTSRIVDLPSRKQIADYKKRAAALIKKSLEVMPADLVIDMGEPNPTGSVRYQLGDQSITGYTDGVLYEYVEILYAAGDKVAANKLAKTLCGQLESVFKYIDNSDARIVSDLHTIKDFYAAMEAYFTIYRSVADPDLGEPRSDLAQRMNNKLKQVYSDVLPSLYKGLEDAAEDTGESTRRGSTEAGLYANRLFSIQDFMKAMAIANGMMEDDSKPSQEQMMQQQMMQQQMQGNLPSPDDL